MFKPHGTLMTEIRKEVHDSKYKNKYLSLILWNSITFYKYGYYILPEIIVIGLLKGEVQ